MEEKREEHCIIAGIIDVNPPPSIFGKDLWDEIERGRTIT
jgi:hypothetical protein